MKNDWVATPYYLDIERYMGWRMVENYWTPIITFSRVQLKFAGTSICQIHHEKKISNSIKKVLHQRSNSSSLRNILINDTSLVKEPSWSDSSLLITVKLIFKTLANFNWTRGFPEKNCVFDPIMNHLDHSFFFQSYLSWNSISISLNIVKRISFHTHLI